SAMDEPLELFGASDELEDGLGKEPPGSLSGTDGCAVARIRPEPSVRAEAGFNRVPKHVEDCVDEVGLACNSQNVGSIGEEVSRPSVPPIRADRMSLVQDLEADGEAALRYTQNDMMMVRHHAPGKHFEAVTDGDCRQPVRERLIVDVVPRDPPAIAAATHHVIDAVGVDHSTSASHGANVARDASRLRDGSLEPDTRDRLRRPPA